MPSPMKPYNLPLIKPGLGYNRNSLIVPPEIMQDIRNVDIHQGGSGRRGGTSILYDISGDPRITGLHDFQLQNGDRYLVQSTADGKIYKDNSNTIKTGLSTRYGESLNENDFATHANWDVTGDFSDSGGNAAFTYSSGTGTLTQTKANLLLTLRPNTLYELTYTVSAASAGNTVTIPTTVATSAATLDVSTATTKTVTFFTVDNVTNFVINGVSTGNNFTIDDLYLKEVGGAARSVKFNTYQNKLVYTNGLEYPQTWNGSDASADTFSGTTSTSISFVGDRASVNFYTNPTAGDTLTIHDHVMTFASPAPGADDILIGASLTDTIDNAVSKLNSHANIHVAKCTWSRNGNDLYALRDSATVGDPYLFSVNITDGAAITGAQLAATIQLGANPAADDILVVNGNVFTFKTAPTVNSQIEIGANLAATLDNIVAHLSSGEVQDDYLDLTYSTYTENGTNTLTITATDTTNGINYKQGADIAGTTTVVGGVALGGIISSSGGAVNFTNRGFLSGQTVLVENSSSNDGSYTLCTNFPVPATGVFIGYGQSTDTEAAGATTTVTWGTPTDWTTGDTPKYSHLYNAGNSKGLIFYGVRSYPNSLYIIPDGTFDCSDSNRVKFTIETAEPEGIIGAKNYGGRTFVFSRSETWYLDLSDPNTSNWNYIKIPPQIGAINDRCIVEAGNDLHIMSPDGNIYSLKRILEYGDYDAASLTRITKERPWDIERWLTTNINFDYWEDFHARYDYEIDAVFWYFVRSGQTTHDTALVYFIHHDRWIIWDNRTYNSGYSASCSCTYTGQGNKKKMLTGDHSGNVWKHHQTTQSDNSNAYSFYMLSQDECLPREDMISERNYDRVFFLQETQADQNLTVSTWIDGAAIVAAGSVAQTDYTVLETKGPGRSFKFEITQAQAGEDVFLKALVFYFKGLTLKPD